MANLHFQLSWYNQITFWNRQALVMDKNVTKYKKQYSEKHHFTETAVSKSELFLRGLHKLCSHIMVWSDLSICSWQSSAWSSVISHTCMHGGFILKIISIYKDSPMLRNNKSRLILYSLTLNTYIQWLKSKIGELTVELTLTKRLYASLFSVKDIKFQRTTNGWRLGLYHTIS